MNGGDATLFVGLFFGSSFALLGFLIGYVMEARRRDQAAAALIREQVDTIAATRARLAQSEKLAALGQLATAIAHEVRNPLAVIRSAAQGIGETVPAASRSIVLRSPVRNVQIAGSAPSVFACAASTAGVSFSGSKETVISRTRSLRFFSAAMRV